MFKVWWYITAVEIYDTDPSCSPTKTRFSLTHTLLTSRGISIVCADIVIFVNILPSWLEVMCLSVQNRIWKWNLLKIKCRLHFQYVAYRIALKLVFKNGVKRKWNMKLNLSHIKWFTISLQYIYLLLGSSKIRLKEFHM